MICSIPAWYVHAFFVQEIVCFLAVVAAYHIGKRVEKDPS